MPKVLDKGAKIIALKKGLFDIKRGNTLFMCNSVSSIFNLDCDNDKISEYIPEFTFENVTELARKHKLKKPQRRYNDNGGGWWEIGNKRIRIAILNLLIKQIENPPMVAKLVTFTLTTRVVVPQFATDEQICNAAIPRLSEKIVNELQENLDCVVDDLECPYIKPTK